MFISTPKDILFIVLAFAAVWVAVFLCWALYYVARLLRNANEIVEEVRERANRIEEAVRLIRDKVEHLSGSFTFVSEAVLRIVNFFMEKKKEKKMKVKLANEEMPPESIQTEAAPAMRKKKR